VLIEVLSNYPVAAVRTTELEFIDQHRRVAEHGRAVANLEARHADSRRWWQVRKRLAQAREVQKLRAAAPIVDPSVERRLAQRQAGVAAEDQVTIALQSLSDDWLLFRGYANRRGEVDHLAVGPGGIWAIEVKYRGVRVHVSGDQWRYEKFDRYGNLVEQGMLVDRGGRSWGRQVTEIARDLETFLSRRMGGVAVQTAVVVIHDRAELGSLWNSPINALSIGTDHLLNLLWHAPITLDADNRSKAVQLIRRDHTFHAERRASSQHMRWQSSR
jgi:hypothetical protein